MIVQFKQRGYAHEVYEVRAEQGEQLTKEMVEERMCQPFGCEVRQQGEAFIVKVYTD